MRVLPALLLLAGLVVGCDTSPATAPTEDPSRAARVLQALRGRLANVVDAQAAADAQLNEVLGTIRRLDQAVVDLEREATFDARLSDHDDLHEEVTDTSAGERLREPWFDVAEVVDRAREDLSEAREVLDDPWEVDYLDAQDAVLVAVREYARVSDRVAQLVVRHWPTYEQVDARIVEVAEHRDDYRDAGEARDALLVELGPLLDDLATAQEQLAEYRDRRQEAGRAVNEATADAVTVYDQRPAAGGRAP